MNAKHVELLRRLEQFQLDSPEASLPFSARLARENNWSPAYAQRVIADGRPYLLDIHTQRDGIGAASTWHPAYSVADLRTRRV